MNQIKENSAEQVIIIGNAAKSDDWKAGRGASCGSTDRVGKLNEKQQSTPLGVCLHRAKVYTEVYKNTEDYAPVLRRAKATAATLDTLAPFIVDGEMIVSSQATAPRLHPIHPETDCNWINEEGGLAAIATRRYNPFYATPEQVKEFDDVIYPYWKDRTVTSIFRRLTPAWLQERTMGCGFAESAFPLSLLGSHAVLDWESILLNGTNGLKKIAQAKLAAFDYMDPKEMGKDLFYEAVIIELEAVERFARKYAAHARELAANEKDAKRKAELEKIGEVCDRVPHEAPRSFHEALQAVWSIYPVIHNDGTGPIYALGRFDQYMYPYYKKDIDAGILTKAEAQELLECFFLKLNEHQLFTDGGTASFLPGSVVFQNLQVGGTDKWGNDATNELSYMCIDALMEIRTVQPALAVKLHERSPEEFRMKLMIPLQKQVV